MRKTDYHLDNLARAYLTRLSRLERHFVDKYHWKENAPTLLAAELCGLHALSIGANESIQDVLSRHNLLNLLPDESQYNLLFRPDNVNFGLALDEKAPMDCLGRTGLHQALDAVPTLEKRYEKRGSVSLGQLETFVSDQPLDYINQQDILGRTLLHLACEKGWEQGVRKLLEKGADPSLQTAYGSLPLHYAAAVGHVEITRMLLDDGAAIAANTLDCRNNTAMYYACRFRNIDLVHLLLEYIGPAIGGTAPTSSPITKVGLAIVTTRTA